MALSLFGVRGLFSGEDALRPYLFVLRAAEERTVFVKNDGIKEGNFPKTRKTERLVLKKAQKKQKNNRKTIEKSQKTL